MLVAQGAERPRRGEASIRRYQLQLLDPNWGGWHTVVTAVSSEALATSARTLNWQTQSPVRIVDPEGHVVRRLDPDDSQDAPVSRASK